MKPVQQLSRPVTHDIGTAQFIEQNLIEFIEELRRCGTFLVPAGQNCAWGRSNSI
jgi:hypothetical protein